MSQFDQLSRTISILFWNLLDPGSVGDFGCHRVQQKAPRALAMTIFSIFLILTFIVLLNLLIASINNSILMTNQQGMRKFKYHRTLLWMRYIDMDSHLPVPLNIIELLLQSLSQAKCKSQAEAETQSKDKYYH